MSSCCSAELLPSPKRQNCPSNGSTYKAVPFKTVLHHLKQPWRAHVKDQAYYFCDDTQCDVVYFADDKTTIKQAELRTAIGIKQQTDDSIICYCFNVTRQNALTDKHIKQFVIDATKNKQCHCEISNPSGKCCLKDFPK